VEDIFLKKEAQTALSEVSSQGAVPKCFLRNLEEKPLWTLCFSSEEFKFALFGANLNLREN
jgi:hypothetical protein